jgi:hypothetical protein
MQRLLLCTVTFSVKPALLLFPKTLQVLRHLMKEPQVLGVEALDLHAGASVLGEVDTAICKRVILSHGKVNI